MSSTQVENVLAAALAAVADGAAAGTSRNGSPHRVIGGPTDIFIHRTRLPS